MLLAVMSLAENGGLTENRVAPDPELVELFRKYFEVVRAGNDSCTPENPFYYLKGEGFWHLHGHAGREAEVDAMSGPGSWGTIAERVSYASLEEGLYELICQPVSREVLRDALIGRYFPDRRGQVLDIAEGEQDVGKVRKSWEAGKRKEQSEGEAARNAAFSRTVRRAYDYRCAACGVRFIYEDTTLIDAAHLIPWSESHDDRPQNGMALCKNHHWVMDKRLIAPGPDMRWHVSRRLDRRIEGQARLVELRGESVLLPREKSMYPSTPALEWRATRLLGEN